MTAKVPVLVGGVDIYALPLTTMEGFVLSRVDGSATCDDIAMMTSVQSRDLDAILDRLESLGALRQPWKSRARRAAQAVPVKASGPAPEVLYDEPEAPPDYELSELDDLAEINLAARRRILNAFHTVDDFNLYQVLGVAQDADKAEIRGAYFALSKRFHPDAFFGKKLGAYQPKIEHVFQRLTEAYETLGRRKRRAEYDQYLATTSATQQVTAVLAQAQKEAEELRAAPESAALFDADGMPSSDALRAPKVPEVAQPRPARPVREPQTSSPDLRRKAAAARLRRGLDSMIPAAASSIPPAASSEPERPPSAPAQSKQRKRESVIKELARTLKTSATGSPSSPTRIGHYLEQAKTSEERGDVVGASNSLQLALAMQPDNEHIKAEYARVSAGVAAALAGNYEKQARYEERVGKWEAAAASWARVVEGRPDDASANRSAALALLRASGDLHLAQRCAETAVRLQPGKVDNLIALAEVYLGAGLKLNARRELEKAVKLDANNEVAKNLLREAK